MAIESTFALFALAGATVGVCIGLTGIGAGSLMTPILTGVFGLAPASAVAHSLAGAAVAKVAGAAVHGWRMTVRWHALGWMLAGAVPGALLSLLWLHMHSADPAVNALIRRTIGWAVLVTVLLLLLRPWLQRLSQARSAERVSDPVRKGLMLLAGAVIGPLVMISSVGAGVIGATVLILLNPDMEPAELAGTDIAFALPLAILGGLGHALMGRVDPVLLAALLAGYVPGIALASAVARHIPQRFLAWLLSAALGAAALRMIG
jgi:uncharacterized protein